VVPELTLNDLADDAPIDTVFFTKCLHCHNSGLVFLPDSPNFLIGKLGLPIPLSPVSLFRVGYHDVRDTVESLTFSCHVGHVVSMRTKKQMVRLYASWHVTFVTDLHTWWDWAIVYFPCYPMSKNWYSIDVQFAISGSDLSSSPEPTLITFALGNLSPKSFDHILI